MKKLLLGIAACVLIMTSCAKQEVTETVDDGKGQLSFSTGLGKTTKAAELMNAALKAGATNKTNGIALFTYEETTTTGTYKEWFQDNLWWATKEWTIETTRFRNKAKTKYVAYFPKTGVNAVDDGGTSSFLTADFATKFPAFTYTVGTTSANQVDLIAGITDVTENKTDIVLAMRHILSQVNFGTVGYPGANIMIRNIEIVEVFNSGTYTYGPVDDAKLGVWSLQGTGGTPSTRTAGYEYYNHTNAVDAAKFNEQPLVDDEAKKGETYAFGDGGNAGPGRGTDKWYPIGTNPNPIWANAHATNSTGLANSLILMPQDFKDTDAKVTFEYRITDSDGADVVGVSNPETWEKGEFKLDFFSGTNASQDLDYMSKWESNYRYLYLIDFTDFLDGIALTFTVDVETNPWENHNNGGDDDGEVTVKVAGQPSQTDMNATTFVDGNSWFIATQSEIAPTGIQWAQVVRHEVWNLGDYDFTQIENGHDFIFNFQNVIFNTSVTEVDGTPNPTGTPTVITLTLPAGYTPVAGTGITMTTHAPEPNTWLISAGNESTTATITITNTNAEYSTSATLKTAIEAVAAADAALVYKGTAAVNLTTMEPIALATQGEEITVKFNKVTPIVGKGTKGDWVWNPSNKTATWTHR